VSEALYVVINVMM